MRITSTWFWLAIVVETAFCARKDVHVSVEAGFNDPGFFPLFVESVALEEANVLDFLQLVGRTPFNGTTDEDVYRHLVGFIDNFLDVELLEWSLSIKESAVRLETIRQVAEHELKAFDLNRKKCRNGVVVTAGKAHCGAFEFDQVESPTLQYSFDKFLGPFDSRNANATIYLPSTLQAGPVQPWSGTLDYLKLNSANIILRWLPPSTSTPLWLSSFGVGLDIKKSDYLVIDDRGKQENEVKVNDEEAVHIPAPLTEEEKEVLAYLLVRNVTGSENPFSALNDFVSNFPLLAPTLYNTTEGFSEADNEEMVLQSRNFMTLARMSGIYLNGLRVSEEITPFSLIRLLRAERQKLDLLKKTSQDKLSYAQARSILSAQPVEEEHEDEESVPDEYKGRLVQLGQRYNTKEQDNEQSATLWLNDVTSDYQYRSFSKDLNQLLRQLYPGQFPRIKHNLIQLVFSLDMKNLYSSFVISKYAGMLIRRSLPVRIGIVPIVSEEINGPEQSVTKLFMLMMSEIEKSYGPSRVIDFIESVYEIVTRRHPDAEPASLQASEYDLNEAYKTLGSKGDPYPPSEPEALEAAFREGEGASKWITSCQNWTKRLGQSHSNNAAFFNGVYVTIDSDGGFTNMISGLLQQHVQYLVQSVYFGMLSNEMPDDQIETFFFTRKNILQARNPLIHALDEDVKIVPYDPSRLQKGLLLGSQKPSEVTVEVLADFGSTFGIELLKHILNVKETNENVRFILLHNSEKDAILMVEDVKHTIEPSHVDLFSKEEVGIVVNGRQIGPFSRASFNEEDIILAIEYEYKKRIKTAVKAIEDLDTEIPSTAYSDLVYCVSNILSAESVPNSNGLTGHSSKKRVPLPMLDTLASPKSSILVSTPTKETITTIHAIYDPTSSESQRSLSILQPLSKLESVSILLIFPLQTASSTLPNRFYKYQFDTRLSFDNSGALAIPKIVFERLPRDALLTLEMDVQRSWIVLPLKSSLSVDLDNIRLADLPRDVEVEVAYRLKSLVVEGHARQVPGPARPIPGLELELVSAFDQSFPQSNGTTDTICMSNLGYFQFQATPGLWELQLRHGKSKGLYDMVSVGSRGWNSPLAAAERASDFIPVTTFEGITLYPQFNKQAGKENLSLFDAEAAKSSFTDRFKGLLGLSITKNPNNEVGQKQADINIFTVASGLLYERMALIMIVSVMRHTKSSVKFWFIENFLSPDFMEFIPHMAKHYNFEYELITYKWPHWLREQTEKQRRIWGYKILFLDVLFPLSLDRVIFVDSDQIVRTDLKELIDMDIKGAPYAYAPMGNDRPETAGFRFWETGYWKDFLRGKPYHISALYLVDLKQFRLLSAGDRLRQQYQALTADPHSLANLDQDLPNNMQHDLPIFTLGRDWLWCKTWCSDESLATAKTIDLCNNPLTHEPKLARARQIPEWTVYDNEVASLAKAVKNGPLKPVESTAEKLKHEEL